MRFNVLATAILSAAIAAAVPLRAQSAAEDMLRAMQPWHIDCQTRGCIASVDILRGESHDPPDPKDDKQYVSVAFGIDHGKTMPSVVIFQVDPKAEQEFGIELMLAATVPDGQAWKVEPDTANAIHMKFRKCDTTACAVAIGGGTPDEETLKACADLITKIEASSHLFIGYIKNGHPYWTAVNVALLKEAHAKAVEQAAASK